MPKTILILGGSYTGISTAHYTLKHILPSLPSTETDSYQVVLVSSSTTLFCRPASPRALIADTLLDQSKLFVPLEEQFTQYGEKSFKFIHGHAKHLDHENRTVTVSLVKPGTESESESNEIQIAYHALIIGTGSSTPSPLLSLNSAGKDEIKEQWKTFRTALPSAKTIVIAGGGPAGIETAGELGEHLNGRAGPAIARVAEGFLAKVGVEVIKNVKVESVSPSEAGRKEHVAGKAEIKLSNGETVQADLYIPAYGTDPNTEFVEQSLKGVDGRVATNAQTLRVDKAGPRVYAAGDASDFARPAIPLLTEAIPVLCANLKRDLLVEAGQTVSEERLFTADPSETQLVPIGKSKGVGAVKGWKVPSFFVWLIKGRDYWVGMVGGTWTGKQFAKA
ncbi:NAD(P)/FAD-dependent oxidoreductase [Aspergillus puulaauensis]|uniref:FAD/NAD(P)-binding domain-containing protein n=1 Tax=Aspergillus puulaauensis TaxID=1220207 RepID=A0A7R7XQ88_9EURO|nr:uncharacterized protein APUU_50108S [Aspergillus puulaauensis]BCS25397.1 hypothetical protein APUU_50108S [Aspergillus puulaauensis]